MNKYQEAWQQLKEQIEYIEREMDVKFGTHIMEVVEEGIERTSNEIPHQDTRNNTNIHIAK